MDPPSTTTNLSSPSPQSTFLTSSIQSSSPPTSLIIPISRTDIFPLPSPRTNLTILKSGTKPNDVDGATTSADDDLTLAELQQLVSFPLLPGEGMVDSCGLLDGGRLILTNYRLYVQLGEEEEYHVPLGLIESIEVKELFYLGIGCKDARSYRCTFDNNEQCLQWFGTLLKASEPPRQLQELFAFSYYAWSKENTIDDFTVRLDDGRPPVYDDAAFMKEVQRLQFGSVWRISSANEEYKMCSSYPPKLLVPSNIQDDKLEAVAKFRSSRRIPAVVWRHIGNGAVIARCSQPEVGWLGWRSSDDEDLVKEILHACAMDAMPATALDSYSHSPALSSDEDGGPFGYSGGAVNGRPVTLENGEKEDVRDDIVRPLNGGDLKVNTEKKVLIMDARSYTTAVANRARGGGCECPEYYPSCEIQFMNLANIHSIRKSFHALRQLCSSAADQPNWFSLLEGTRWLLHQSGLMRAAVTLVTAIERDARPVLVHCSDGWDRTPQIVALAQLLLDPYYRTIDGFRILIEREWLAFGHKFADRCGHTTGSEDQNERCPVFLQWLDCVHQLLEQFPCSFEFSDIYLVKLVQHTYSNLFGTFLCNTKKDRDKELFNTFTVWTFLDTALFRNYLYKPAPSGVQVLWPKCNVRDLKPWSAVYLGSLETTKHDNTAQTTQQPTDNINNASNTIPLFYQDNITTPTGNHKATSTSNTKRTTSTALAPVNQHRSNVVSKQHAGSLMTKTRSYGDLLHMGSLTTCSKQCNNSANNGLQARVGVGGVCVTDGEKGAGLIEEGKIGVRRLSDPSSVDIKILNLAMVEHTDTSHQSNMSTFPIPHTYTIDQTATVATSPQNAPTQNASSETQLSNRSSTLMPNGATATEDSHCSDSVVNMATKCPKERHILDVGDINHNDSCEDLTACEFLLTKPLLSGVVSTLKDSCERILNGNSVDTSTETLVADNYTVPVRVFSLNTSPPTKHDETDSGRTTNTCQNNHNQFQPTTAKLTCSVCAQNKRFVNETHFNHHHHHHKSHLPANEESSINKNHQGGGGGNNYSNTRSMATTVAQQYGPVQMTTAVNHLSNVQCCNIAADIGSDYMLNGYYGSGSSNVTSGVNTPTSLMTDDSVTAGVNMMGSPGMSTSGYWGVTSGRIVPNAAALLGDDGLVPLRSEMQDRVATLIEENRREVERLKQELQKYRYALLQQLCHRCHHKSNDKNDDASSAASHRTNTSPTLPNASNCHCTLANPSYYSTLNPNPSLPRNGYNCADGTIGGGSSCAAGESAGVAASSLRSDHSWDNVDDVSLLDQGGHCIGRGGNPTLWMPDHAVSRCADCRCEFWIGRRRHHCRKCGQIFCAECSEHYAPIPTEHLYAPVRVCRGCFTTLRQSNADLGLTDDIDIEINNVGDGNITVVLDGFSGNNIPRAANPHFTSMSTAPQKPPPSQMQPMQCCHHQHQQQAASTSTSAGGCVGSSVTVGGSGGGGGGANGGGQCRQITASSN